MEIQQSVLRQRNIRPRRDSQCSTQPRRREEASESVLLIDPRIAGDGIGRGGGNHSPSMETKIILIARQHCVPINRGIRRVGEASSSSSATCSSWAGRHGDTREVNRQHKRRSRRMGSDHWEM